MTHEKCINERLRATDATFIELPLLGEYTYNELHASVLGLAIGVIAGRDGAFLRTILREPWYALGLYLVGYGIGVWLRRTRN